MYGLVIRYINGYMRSVESVNNLRLFTSPTLVRQPYLAPPKQKPKGFCCVKSHYISIHENVANTDSLPFANFLPVINK